jgi:hypothetical protein
MKRIALSLAAIGMVVAMSAAATGAYFSNATYVNGNTFSTGTVQIGDMSGTHLSVTNLEPGVWTSAYQIGVPYIGSLNADLYMGLTTTDTTIADALTVQIYNNSTGFVWEGPLSNLYSTWEPIATNVAPQTDGTYGISFYLDPSYTNQGATNVGLVFLVYAEQAGGPAPTSPGPYGFNNWY